MKEPQPSPPPPLQDANYRRLSHREASLLRLIGEAYTRPGMVGVLRRKLLTVGGRKRSEVGVSRQLGLSPTALTNMLTISAEEHERHGSDWIVPTFVRLAVLLEIGLDVLWACVVCSREVTQARRARFKTLTGRRRRPSAMLMPPLP